MYVGYRFYDEADIDPLFPFGHGLSYTTFELSSLELTKGSSHNMQVKCTLRNTGQRAGAEVIQLYVAPVSPPVKRPLKELKEFRKVWLAQSAEEVITIPVDLIRATSFWDETSSSWCSYQGTYRIMVGTSSRGNFLEDSVELGETTFWSGN